MSISFLDALRRILDSQAINEGRDAQCVLLGRDGEPHPPQLVRQLLETMLVAGDPRDQNEPVSIRRTTRNWEIVRVDGDPIVQVHPWDDSENVATIGARPDATLSTSLVQFSSRVQQLANEAERLRQFVIAKTLWEIVATVNNYTGVGRENAIQEARRMHAIVAALVSPHAP